MIQDHNNIKTTADLRQELIDHLHSDRGWSTECETSAHSYAQRLIEEGSSNKAVKSKLTSLGLSKKGASDVIKNSGNPDSDKNGSWDYTKISRHRTFYHILFFLQFGLNLCAAFSGQGEFAFLSLMVWLVFLIVFSRIAILLLDHTIVSMAFISFCLTIIPFINLIIIAIIDRRIWRALHRDYC